MTRLYLVFWYDLEHITIFYPKLCFRLALTRISFIFSFDKNFAFFLTKISSFFHRNFIYFDPNFIFVTFDKKFIFLFLPEVNFFIFDQYFVFFLFWPVFHFLLFLAENMDFLYPKFSTIQNYYRSSKIPFWSKFRFWKNKLISGKQKSRSDFLAWWSWNFNKIFEKKTGNKNNWKYNEQVGKALCSKQARV